MGSVGILACETAMACICLLLNVSQLRPRSPQAPGASKRSESQGSKSQRDSPRESDPQALRGASSTISSFSGDGKSANTEIPGLLGLSRVESWRREGREAGQEGGACVTVAVG